LLTTTPILTVSTTWNIDPVHSTAQFKIKHMMISNVKGEFTSISGVLVLNESDIIQSRVDAAIDAASINTRVAQRDTHLKSADFFDVGKFQKLTFTSTRVKKIGDCKLSVDGDLTIHGVTRSVVFDVDGPSGPIRDPYGNTRIGLSATTKINRRDFGMTWNSVLESGGILVGDEVTITLDAELLKQG
jgi:polyisoprenoid-binding protein YceI